MTTPWFRICVDLDHDGNWRGSSAEVRSIDRLVAVHVYPPPGPFDNHHTILTHALEDLEGRYGVQLRLI